MNSEDKVCLVCSTPNNSLHFGVEVCRACSSFFKRITLSGRRLPCRRGDRNCEVNRVENTTCRRCRYEKCLAVGIVYNGPLRSNKKCDTEANNLQKPCPVQPSTSKCDSLLERIGREYEINIANRREKETALLRTCKDAKRLPHPIHEIYECTADIVVITMHFAIDEIWTLFHRIFPCLSEVPFQEQIELYRFYLPNFTMIDSYLRTWKVWGVFDKFSMCSVMVCIDLESPDLWIRAEEGGCNRRTLIDSTIVYVRDQMSVIVPSLTKARLTEKEVYALFALMLCDTDTKLEVSEHLLSLMDDLRDEILSDLQAYYREELGLNDYSTRLGNLMTVCHAVRECGSHFRSFFRMQVTLFDLWSAETQLKELLL